MSHHLNPNILFLFLVEVLNKWDFFNLSTQPKKPIGLQSYSCAQFYGYGIFWVLITLSIRFINGSTCISYQPTHNKSLCQVVKNNVFLDFFNFDTINIIFGQHFGPNIPDNSNCTSFFGPLVVGLMATWLVSPSYPWWLKERQPVSPSHQSSLT